MKTDINNYPDFYCAVQSEPLVYLFGTGISAALTGQKYSWWEWISDGIRYMKDPDLKEFCEKSLNENSSTENMIHIVGKVLSKKKKNGTYEQWMKDSFETNPITNEELSHTLKKLLITKDVFATTNYDRLLEEATGLEMLTYENPDATYTMLDRHISTHVLHIHGAFDSVRGIDNIIADEDQYEAIKSDRGAQFIQNILGTRTLIFIGCGKTTEDGNVSRFIQFANEYLKMDKEYYFLYKTGESITGMPDNIKLISYGDEYTDLRPFLEDMAQVRIRAKIESNPLVLRTAYSTNKADSYGLSQYYFANEYLKFCGRTIEIAQLLNFSATDKKISWWAVTGQAGAGKSRLAYELLHRLPNHFFGFFLNYSTDVDLITKFEPFADTLVIIDYVQGNENRVAAFVSRLIDKYTPTFYKLRILFLERDNLLLSGSWFDLLGKAFDVFHRGIFSDCEYNVDMTLRKHRFLYLDDLDDDAVLELIGRICSQKGLPKDTYRDKRLKEDYGQKFEQLKFRPLFLQLYVETWIENGCIQLEYRNYTDLLETVMKREQERILHLVKDEIDTCNALIRLIIRANISDTLLTSDIPEFYKKDWDKVKNFAKTHTLSGSQRLEFLQSLIEDAAQEITDCSAVIKPQYPDIIKEYMFLYFMDEDEISDVSKELWEHCPQEYNSFLVRCISDFHDHELLTGFIRNTSADYQNIHALRVRLALLQNKVVHSVQDGSRLIQLIRTEYDFWCDAPIDHNSVIEQKEIQLQGYYYSAEQFCGWSMEKEFYEAIQKIADYDRIPELIPLEISYLMEFAHYFTEKNNYDNSIKICHFIEPLLLYLTTEKEKMNAWLSFQGENILNLIYQRKLEQVYELHDQIFDAIDWEEEKQVELYAYIWFSAAKMCSDMFEWRQVLDFAYYLQDLAEDYAEQTRNIYFNDRTHYYYLHAKLIKIEASSIGSMMFGMKTYGILLIDEIIAEIEANEMIPDFSGLLVAAKTLKIRMDDSVTDNLIKSYFIEADTFLDRYPDSTLLAEKSINLWETAYVYKYKTTVPKQYVDRGYALALRFANNQKVIDNFFQLLKNSSEVVHWMEYVDNKQIVSQLIEFNMGEYLMPPIITQETVKRKHPKVGANDPCPCGSGKKFKKCCRGNGRFD